MGAAQAQPQTQADPAQLWLHLWNEQNKQPTQQPPPPPPPPPPPSLEISLYSYNFANFINNTVQKFDPNSYIFNFLNANLNEYSLFKQSYDLTTFFSNFFDRNLNIQDKITQNLFTKYLTFEANMSLNYFYKGTNTKISNNNGNLININKMLLEYIVNKINFTKSILIFQNKFSFTRFANLSFLRNLNTANKDSILGYSLQQNTEFKKFCNLIFNYKSVDPLLVLIVLNVKKQKYFENFIYYIFVKVKNLYKHQLLDLKNFEILFCIWVDLFKREIVELHLYYLPLFPIELDDETFIKLFFYFLNKKHVDFLQVSDLQKFYSYKIRIEIMSNLNIVNLQILYYNNLISITNYTILKNGFVLGNDFYDFYGNNNMFKNSTLTTNIDNFLLALIENKEPISISFNGDEFYIHNVNTRHCKKTFAQKACHSSFDLFINNQPFFRQSDNCFLFYYYSNISNISQYKNTKIEVTIKNNQTTLKQLSLVIDQDFFIKIPAEFYKLNLDINFALSTSKDVNLTTAKFNPNIYKISETNDDLTNINSVFENITNVSIVKNGQIDLKNNLINLEYNEKNIDKLIANFIKQKTSICNIENLYCLSNKNLQEVPFYFKFIRVNNFLYTSNTSTIRNFNNIRDNKFLNTCKIFQIDNTTNIDNLGLDYSKSITITNTSNSTKLLYQCFTNSFNLNSVTTCELDQNDPNYCIYMQNNSIKKNSIKITKVSFALPYFFSNITQYHNIKKEQLQLYLLTNTFIFTQDNLITNNLYDEIAFLYCRDVGEFYNTTVVVSDTNINKNDTVASFSSKNLRLANNNDKLNILDTFLILNFYSFAINIKNVSLVTNINSDSARHHYGISQYFEFKIDFELFTYPISGLLNNVNFSEKIIVNRVEDTITDFYGTGGTGVTHHTFLNTNITSLNNKTSLIFEKNQTVKLPLANLEHVSIVDFDILYYGLDDMTTTSNSPTLISKKLYRYSKIFKTSSAPNFPVIRNNLLKLKIEEMILYERNHKMMYVDVCIYLKNSKFSNLDNRFLIANFKFLFNKV